MMTCCKEKVVLVAVYEEKPRKRSLPTRNNENIKHRHHHHHHHHLHVHQSKNNKGNRRAELLSYSQHLRGSSKQKASTPPSRPKTLVPSTANEQETLTQVHDAQNKQKLKKQSSPVGMNNVFKCIAMSHAKRKVKKKKKNNSESASKKANVIMKRFNERTQKGARRFFSKLKAFIQKYR